MISLAFSAQRKIIRFIIEEKAVKYYDDNWKQGIQVYPMDKHYVKRLIASRKKGLSAMGLLIADANLGENLKQYKACKTEEDLAEMIIKDCKSKGLVQIK